MIPNFREESCTYLMLRLKVALKKHDPTLQFSFYGTAAQVKTVAGAFPANGYEVTSAEHGDDCYLITLTKVR